MDRVFGGIDIGGTKCAVVLGRLHGEGVHLLEKVQFLTPNTPKASIEAFIQMLDHLLAKQARSSLVSIGISCGGPLDSKRGLIMGPPNLPGWNQIDLFTPLKEHFAVPVALRNDANACALAEWRWGAGKGTRSMVFLTFGTGLGAGLILNGQLYEGASGVAGEIGHWRLAEHGPIGYGKEGSFEGFCSGGGMAQLAQSMIHAWWQAGKQTSICREPSELAQVTARRIGEAAQQGDELALLLFKEVGRRLGQGLSLLMDVLNPEMIVIGSIYARQRSMLEPYALEIIENEALKDARDACRIVPAQLLEHVGDYASLSVAMECL